jgi:hypothetical protein
MSAWRWRWLGACLVAASTTAQAADRPDLLVASLGASHVEEMAQEGYTAAVEWVHRFSHGASGALGLSWKQFGDYRRRLATVGGDLPLGGDDCTIGAKIEAGPATNGDDTYSHVQTTERLDFAFDPRIVLGVEHRYIAAGPLDGQLLGIAANFIAHRTVALQLKHATTIAGNLGARATSARVDYAGPAQLFTGAATGRTSPRLFEASLADGGRFRQYYAGLAMPLRTVTLTVVLDRFSSGSQTQWTATLVASLPIPER